jgi:hypothetical protein
LQRHHPKNRLRRGLRHDQAYRKDALAWKLRRDRGVVCTEIDAAGIAKLVPALARNFERGVYLPEQGM